MELREFIKTAINSIANGIIDAQNELNDKNVIINPERVDTGKGGQKVLRSNGWRYAQQLEFEILVNAEDKSSDEKGGKLTVFNITKIGIDNKHEQIVSNTNKL